MNILLKRHDLMSVHYACKYDMCEQIEHGFNLMSIFRCSTNWFYLNLNYIHWPSWKVHDDHYFKIVNLVTAGAI